MQCCLPRSFFTKEQKAFFPSGGFQLWQKAVVGAVGIWEHSAALWPESEAGQVALVCRTVLGVIWSRFGIWSKLSDSRGCLHGDEEWVTSWDHQVCPAAQSAEEAPASGPLLQVTPTLPCSHLEKPKLICPQKQQFLPDPALPCSFPPLPPPL